MKTRLSYIAPALTLSALVCVALASVSTDYDHKADFSRYHTYSWLSVKASNSLWQNRIMEAVDTQIAAKGWSKVPSGGDAVISAFGKTTEQDSLQTFYDGFPGWGWRGWGGTGTATTEVIPEKVGSLNVDIFDGATKQLIWRGVSTETISPGNPEKNDKKLEKAVVDMFKKFPPNGRS